MLVSCTEITEFKGSGPLLISSIITPELIFKSGISGIIGSIDSIILVFAYRFNLRGGQFYVTWAGLTAFVHFLMKLLAGSLSSLPDSVDVAILSVVRSIALALSIWVVFTSWREMKHISHHVKEPESKPSLNKTWSLERAHLWVPAILLGAIDAYPIGTIKGLLLTRPDMLKTFLSSALGSVEVGLITLTVAYLVLRIEHRLSPFHVGTLILGRILHLSIFTGITLAILIEWYYVFNHSPHNEFQILITPLLSAVTMTVFLVFRHWKRWKKLMAEANRCELP